MAKVSRILVHAVPKRHFDLHTYELRMREDGTFRVYEKVPGARKTEDLLVPLPTSLDVAAQLILDGHPARFEADGPTYFGNSVMSIGSQKITVEYV